MHVKDADLNKESFYMTPQLSIIFEYFLKNLKKDSLKHKYQIYIFSL